MSAETLLAEARELGEFTPGFEQAQLLARKARVGLSLRLEALLRAASDPDNGPDVPNIVAEGFSVTSNLDALSDHMTNMQECLAARVEIARQMARN